MLFSDKHRRAIESADSYDESFISTDFGEERPKGQKYLNFITLQNVPLMARRGWDRHEVRSSININANPRSLWLTLKNVNFIPSQNAFLSFPPTLVSQII
jgi:hypothetical protein